MKTEKENFKNTTSAELINIIKEKVEELKNDYIRPLNPSVHKDTIRIEVYIEDEKVVRYIPVKVFLCANGEIRVERMFGYLEIEGDIQNEGSCKDDVDLVKMCNRLNHVWKDGAFAALVASKGIKNPKYDPEAGILNIFENEIQLEYTNEVELRNEAEMLTKEYKHYYDCHNYETDYKDIYCGNMAVRLYQVADLAQSFCKFIILPVEYKLK